RHLRTLCVARALEGIFADGIDQATANWRAAEFLSAALGGSGDVPIGRCPPSACALPAPARFIRHLLPTTKGPVMRRDLSFHLTGQCPGGEPNGDDRDVRGPAQSSIA